MVLYKKEVFFLTINRYKTTDLSKYVEKFKFDIGGVDKKTLFCSDFIEKISLEILQLYSTNDSPVSIEMIAKDMGFEIQSKEMTQEKIKSLLIVDKDETSYFDSEKVIVVNIQHNVHQQRVSIAHALAHYLFDYNEDSSYIRASYENETKSLFECRADRFASALLMPKHHFIDKFYEFGALETFHEAMDNLSLAFQVSNEEIYKRIIEVL